MFLERFLGPRSPELGPKFVDRTASEIVALVYLRRSPFRLPRANQFSGERVIAFLTGGELKRNIMARFEDDSRLYGNDFRIVLGDKADKDTKFHDVNSLAITHDRKEEGVTERKEIKLVKKNGHWTILQAERSCFIFQFNLEKYLHEDVQLPTDEPKLTDQEQADLLKKARDITEISIDYIGAGAFVQRLIGPLIRKAIDRKG